MSKTWVVNASPVITLAKAGYLQILDKLVANLVIPEPVARELLTAEASDPARRALENAWGKIVGIDQISARVLEWGLGAGESSVLTLSASIPGSVAIIDDAEARKCARTLNVPFIGTLGVVLRARLDGHIDSAAKAIFALRKAGLYLDDRTIAEALQKSVGEAWPPR